MKKQLFLAAFLALGTLGFSQTYLKSDQLKVKKVDQNGVLTFAAFQNNANIALSESKALLKEALQLNQQHELVEMRSETDVFGTQHIRYKQLYNGIEVAYHSYAVHAKNGVITSINGNYAPIEINTQLAALKSPAAIFKMGNFHADLPAEFQDITPKHKLVVLPKANSLSHEDRYAYAFPVISMSDKTFEKVYLDAITGETLRKESLLMHHQNKTVVFTEEQMAYVESIQQQQLKQKQFSPFIFTQGNAETRYSGTRAIDTQDTAEGFTLQDTSRHLSTLNFQNDYLMVVITLMFGEPEDVIALAEEYIDQDNQWTAEEYAATKDDGALEAHWAFSEVYDFFKEQYDRDGFDNEDSPVASFIHTTFFGSAANAAWLSLSDLDEDLKGGFMFIGDGHPGQMDILASLDVIGHEYSHGVTNAASGLVYERESGALNEGFADIWSSTIEAKKAPEKQRWMLGEDFMLTQPAGMRSLENPKLFGQPDTYMGIRWADASDDCIPSSGNDNCGVHTNSGVLNYWYYLLSEGGSGTNDNGYAYEVPGITIEKAADLVYAVQLNYVQYQSKFADVRDYTIQEAQQMFGENSPEVTSVEKAWCAVGVTTGEACEFLAVQDVNTTTLQVFPNPATDILNVVAAHKNGHSTYQITNAAGQIVMKGKLVDQKINVSLLAKGVYVLTLKDGQQTQNTKFVKK